MARKKKPKMLAFSKAEKKQLSKLLAKAREIKSRQRLMIQNGT